MFWYTFNRKLRVHKHRLSYRRRAELTKTWFMHPVWNRMTFSLLNVWKTKFCSFSFQHSPHFSSPSSPLNLPSTQLLHLARSLCDPLDATQAQLRARETGSGSRKRQTASGWSAEFTAPVWRGEQLHDDEPWHLCLHPDKDVAFTEVFLLFTAFISCYNKTRLLFCPHTATRGAEIVKFKFCSNLSSLVACSMPMNTKIFSCNSPWWHC